MALAASEQAAFRSIVDAWVYALEEDLLAAGDVSGQDAAVLVARTNELIEKRLAAITELAPAFSAALRGYRAAVAAGENATAEALLAWVSGQPNVAAAAKRTAGIKGEIDHFSALCFLQGLLIMLRDAGFAGLVLVLDEVETLQRVRGDVREKALNALRQLIDELLGDRFPGLYLVITGTPAFFDGPQGVQKLPPLAQRLHADFGSNPRFDNPRAPQVRLRNFDLRELVEVGRKVRDLYADGIPNGGRIHTIADDAYLETGVKPQPTSNDGNRNRGAVETPAETVARAGCACPATHREPKKVRARGRLFPVRQKTAPGGEHRRKTTVCILAPSWEPKWKFRLEAQDMAQRGFAGVSGTHFTLNDLPFYLTGANNYYLIYKSEFMINSVLDMALAMGLKVVRTWAFLDRGSLDGSVPDVDPPGAKEGVYFQYWDPARGAPAFNDGPNGLLRLDYVVHAAGQRGLKLILPLVNNWQPFGGIDQYVTWYGLNSHHEFYTHPKTRDAYKNWALHLLNRRNVYTGVLYKDDPTIMAWELANEPRCQGTIERLNSPGCSPAILTGWVQEMSAFLKQNDSKHLVTVGDEGFFRRSGGSDWLRNGSQGVDFDAFLRTASIDFGTLHLYPDNWGKDVDWATQWIEEHIAAGVEADKPVLIEEYGWMEQTTRDGVFRTWLNAVERHGGAADLIWILAARQDDGSLYPDYDHYTIYGPADAPAVTAHAAVMEGKSGSAVRIAALTSAASYVAGSVAPGEIVTTVRQRHWARRRYGRHAQLRRVGDDFPCRNTCAF